VTSIRGRLLVWLLIPITLAALIADGVTYLKAREQLRAFHELELQAAATAAPIGDGSATSVVGQRVIRIGDRAHATAPAPASAGPPFERAPGMTTVHWQGRDWRVALVERDGRLVQAAEPVDAWRERIDAAAIEIIMPLSVAAVPLLALLVWFGVGRGLRPFTQLASSLRARTPTDLQPLDEGRLPVEVLPLVRSLNGLLQQLAAVLADEHRFIADAAHGLRTPLTALQLQVENLMRATTIEERAAAIGHLAAGVPRASHLVEQLLTMARLAPRDGTSRAREQTDLEALVKDVLIGQQAFAAHRRIDLGLVRSEASVLEADADSLRMALDNLVDNALRYTPPDGVVNLTLYRSGPEAVIVITDTGPGVPAGERTRVFRRFFRGENVATGGNGLGLAIVAEVVRQHGGRIALDDAEVGRGLKVTVHLPLRGRATAPTVEATTKSP
jgi:two-component system, OmpR family, sensor kinase